MLDVPLFRAPVQSSRGCAIAADDRDVPEDSPFRSESPLCHYLNYARHMTGLLERGENKYAKKEWLSDNLEDVMEDIETRGYVRFPWLLAEFETLQAADRDCLKGVAVKLPLRTRLRLRQMLISDVQLDKMGGIASQNKMSFKAVTWAQIDPNLYKPECMQTAQITPL